MKKSCVRSNSLLSQYIDGTLSREKEWEVKMHLAVCSSCVEEVRELSKTVALLRHSPVPALSLHFNEELAARVASSKPSISPIRLYCQNFLDDLRFWSPNRTLRLGVVSATLTLATVLATISLAPHEGPKIVQPSRLASTASDESFIAACSKEHGVDDAAMPISDPSAQSLAERLNSTDSVSESSPGTD